MLQTSRCGWQLGLNAVNSAVFAQAEYEGYDLKEAVWIGLSAGWPSDVVQIFTQYH